MGGFKDLWYKQQNGESPRRGSLGSCEISRSAVDSSICNWFMPIIRGGADAGTFIKNQNKSNWRRLHVRK